MASITENIREIANHIRLLESRYGRAPRSVKLLAVSKQQSPQSILEAWQAGQRDFGENYLQEAAGKMGGLDLAGLCWHFIGPIQSNKTRQLAASFDWVHSIDREKVARRLSEQRDPARGPLNCCIQINISGESSKSGVAPSRAGELGALIRELPGLKWRGIMAIPEALDSFAAQRETFARMHALYESLQQRFGELDCLSMGMSGDYEAAIAEGSTLVRLGTAVFGTRI